MNNTPKDPKARLQALVHAPVNGLLARGIKNLKENLSAEEYKEFATAVLQWAKITACDQITKRGASRMDFEDIAQETATNVLNKFNTFKGEANITTWIYRITKHLINDEYKNKHNRNTVNMSGDESSGNLFKIIAADTPSREMEPYKQLMAAENQAIVHQAMGLLTDEHKEILTLRYLSGDEQMRYEDISQKLGISIGTVRSRLSRAHEALREKIQKLEEGSHVGVLPPKNIGFTDRSRKVDEYIRKNPECMEDADLTPLNKAIATAVIIQNNKIKDVAGEHDITDAAISAHLQKVRKTVIAMHPDIFGESKSAVGVGR